MNIDRASASPEIDRRRGRECEELSQACNGVLMSEAAWGEGKQPALPWQNFHIDKNAPYAPYGFVHQKLYFWILLSQ